MSYYQITFHKFDMKHILHYFLYPGFVIAQKEPAYELIDLKLAQLVSESF